MPKGRPKSNLKAALQAHHIRMTSTDKSKSAAKRESINSKSRSASRKSSIQRNRRPTIPFFITDSILLIGEGNFSFARALMRHPLLQGLPASNITATTNDSEEVCSQKYPDATAILQELRASGVTVLFSVDATRLDRCRGLKGTCWDRIVWNFPHAGKGIADQDRNTLANQILLLDFFKSCSPLLTKGRIPSLGGRKKPVRDNESDEDEDEPIENQTIQSEGARGTVLITLRDSSPYREWDVPGLAKAPPPIRHDNPRYHILRSFSFERHEWPGYEHRMTKGFVEGTGTGADRAHLLGNAVNDRCWEFYLTDISAP